MVEFLVVLFCCQWFIEVEANPMESPSLPNKLFYLLEINAFSKLQKMIFTFRLHLAINSTLLNNCQLRYQCFVDHWCIEERDIFVFSITKFHNVKRFLESGLLIIFQCACWLNCSKYITTVDRFTYSLRSFRLYLVQCILSMICAELFLHKPKICFSVSY